MLCTQVLKFVYLMFKLKVKLSLIYHVISNIIPSCHILTNLKVFYVDINDGVYNMHIVSNNQINQEESS